MGYGAIAPLDDLEVTSMKQSKAKQPIGRRSIQVAGEKSVHATSSLKVRSAAPMPRRSTAASLLKHAAGWTGDDLEDVIRVVSESRSKTRF
jgi:hypothetical protein